METHGLSRAERNDRIATAFCLVFVIFLASIAYQTAQLFLRIFAAYGRKWRRGQGSAVSNMNRRGIGWRRLG